MIRIKLVLIIAVIYLPFWLSIEEMQRRICSDISSILFLNFTQGDKMRNSALTRTSGGMGGLEYQALIATFLFCTLCFIIIYAPFGVIFV